MQAIQAEETLLNYKIADWPNSKEKYRSSEIKRLEKLISEGSNKSTANRASEDALKAWIKGL